MNPYLEDLSDQFDEAYYAAFNAYQAAEGAPSPEEYGALYVIAQSARLILEHLGFVEPFECGQCDACLANQAARAAEMAEALEADEALSPKVNGQPLTAAEEETAARLLGDVFGGDSGRPA